jgi:hypothetical protein
VTSARLTMSPMLEARDKGGSIVARDTSLAALRVL